VQIADSSNQMVDVRILSAFFPDADTDSPMMVGMRVVVYLLNELGTNRLSSF